MNWKVMTMKKSHNRKGFLLGNVKNKALLLRKNYQIPYKLCYYIQHLTIESSDDLIKYLMSLCEHCLRIKGYYKKYPDIESSVNNEIDEGIKQYL